MEDIKIYVATQRKIDFCLDDCYIPIQVGAINNENIGYERDDTKDNISIKNPNYCELTALYWIWKNSRAKIVGLCHYRRYFFKRKFSNNVKYILKRTEIEKYLENYDVILPKKLRLYNYNTEEHYATYHYKEDYELCREIIKEFYPEYLKEFENFSKSYEMYTYNMIIVKREIFDEYSKWLFDILDKLEEKIDFSNYSQNDKRVFGFLAERLLNVWILKNKNELKIKEICVNNIEKNPVSLAIKNKVYYIKWLIKNLNRGND